jgi:hypothetical protein
MNASWRQKVAASSSLLAGLLWVRHADNSSLTLYFCLLNFFGRSALTTDGQASQVAKMDDGRHDDKAATPTDPEGLVKYLKAAIAAARQVDPVIEFYLQLAIKQLEEKAAPGQSRRDMDSPSQEEP